MQLLLADGKTMGTPLPSAADSLKLLLHDCHAW